MVGKMSAAGSSISVNIRVRPFTVKEASQIAPVHEERQFLGDGALASNVSSQAPSQRGIRKIIQVLDERVLVFDPADTNPMVKFQKSLLPGKKVKDMRYAFDHIFDESATQLEVYEHTCKPLLDGLFEGYNATVFAYGATGCGKTHTISGTREDPGLIFQTFKDLFARVDACQDEKTIEMSITYLEIYNETIRDLLVEDGPGKPLNLREDAKQQISVAGLSVHRPESVEHVLDLILQGNANRTISPTEANAVSSRSHAVLQVNMSQKARTANIQEDHTMATLSIIDLAGSERASVTKNRGDRLLEGANINKSLLALGNCINALCDPHRRNHVPYRDSKLTRLLKFSLGGNCRTCMVVCVSPSSAHYDETHNTLKYGNRAKNIKTKVSRNIVSVDRHVGQYVKIIYDLRQEVEELKKKLAERSTTDESALERELRLQNVKYDEGLHQLRAVYETNAQVRESRSVDVARLHRTGMQIANLSAWLSAFAAVCEDDDYRSGLERFSQVRDAKQLRLRELQRLRDHLEHGLRSCQAIGAIETVLGTLQRNHGAGKGDGNKVLCRALDAEAHRLKHKIIVERYASEVDATRKDLALHDRYERELIEAALKSTACLDTDGGQTEEEIAHFDALYATTYDAALETLSRVALEDENGAASATLPLRSTRPLGGVSPARHHLDLPVSRLAIASPRASPRRVKSSKPSTVFPKKRSTALSSSTSASAVGAGGGGSKKSVRWNDADESRDISDANISLSSPHSARDRRMSTVKRRSQTGVHSPPVHKRTRLSPVPLQPTDANAAPMPPDFDVSNSSINDNASGAGGGAGGGTHVRLIKELPLRRPSSAAGLSSAGTAGASAHFMSNTASSNNGVAGQHLPKTSLSGLALANLSHDFDAAGPATNAGVGSGGGLGGGGGIGSGALSGGAARTRNISGSAGSAMAKENDRSSSAAYTSVAAGSMTGATGAASAFSAPAVRQSLAGGPLRAPSGGRVSNVWR